MGLIKTLLVIFLIIVLAVGGSAFYLYNIYVFKTVRACVSPEAQSLNVPCNSSKFCLDTFKSNMSDINLLASTSDLPPAFSEKINEIFNATFYCAKTCKMKRVSTSLDNSSLQCSPDDMEIKLDMHGKEILQMLNYARKHPGISMKVA
jgi:hypothetical protein